MTIGLIDVDGHHFPNLALMKLSAWNKMQGDTVEWWWGFGQYDRVYMSKVFDRTYSQDAPEPMNAHEIIKGGTGYDPYVMIYDKPNAPREIRLLQRWFNNRLIFRAEPDFYKFDPKRG